MSLGPDFLFPVTVDKRGVLNSLPSKETIYKYKLISGPGDVAYIRNLDVRVMTDEGSNFSISTGCVQQIRVKSVHLSNKSTLTEGNCLIYAACKVGNCIFEVMMSDLQNVFMLWWVCPILRL